MKSKIEPMGYAYGRLLTSSEIEQISGAGHQTGSVTGSGGGSPGPIHGSGDADVDYEWD